MTYGENAAERVPELRGIARWAREWADRTNAWSQNLIAFGDLNIDRQDDRLWQALTSTDSTVPADLHAVPRSIFADSGAATTDKLYDQIAWFETEGGRRRLTLEYRRGGHVDFLPFVYTDTDLSKSEIWHRVSDHYPLWVEFGSPQG